MRPRQECSVHIRLVLHFAAMLFAAAAGHAAAAPPDTGRDLASTCAGCHGNRSAGHHAIPVLDGMEHRVIVVRMQEFRSGTRAGTVMPQLARGYTDPEVESIAAWYAAQKAPK